MKALSRCVLVLAWLTAACSEPPLLSPIPPGPPMVIQSFNGTLQPQGTDLYLFSVARAGYVEVTLLAIGPPRTVSVGLGIGRLDDTGTCAVIPIPGVNPVTAQAGPAAQVTGQVTNYGTFCVTIYDVGNLSGPTLYTMTVAHPCDDITVRCSL